jgi:DnaJ-domain-containing protein 1
MASWGGQAPTPSRSEKRSGFRPSPIAALPAPSPSSTLPHVLQRTPSRPSPSPSPLPSKGTRDDDSLSGASYPEISSTSAVAPSGPPTPLDTPHSSSSQGTQSDDEVMVNTLKRRMAEQREVLSVYFFKRIEDARLKRQKKGPGGAGESGGSLMQPPVSRESSSGSTTSGCGSDAGSAGGGTSHQAVAGDTPTSSSSSSSSTGGSSGGGGPGAQHAATLGTGAGTPTPTPTPTPTATPTGSGSGSAGPRRWVPRLTPRPSPRRSSLDSASFGSTHSAWSTASGGSSKAYMDKAAMAAVAVPAWGGGPDSDSPSPPRDRDRDSAGVGAIDRSGTGDSTRSTATTASTSSGATEDPLVPEGFEDSVACRCVGRRKCGLCRGCAGVHCQCRDCWCNTCQERQRHQRVKALNEQQRLQYEAACAAEQERLFIEARQRNQARLSGLGFGDMAVPRTPSEEDMVARVHWDSADPYRRLGLEIGASLPEIKKTYKRLVLLYHPDRSTSPDAAVAFVNIKQAYEELMQMFTGRVDIEA